MSKQITESIYSLNFSTDKAIQQLNKSIATVEKHEQALAKAKKGTAEYEKASDDLARSQKSLDTMLGRSANTIAEMERKQSMLRDTLRHLNRDSKEFKTVLAELTKVNNKLADSYTDTAKKQELLTDKIQNGISNLQGFAVAGVGIAAVGQGFQLMNEIVADTDAKLSQIQKKFKELSKEQVEDLTSSIDGAANAYQLEFDEISSAINSAAKEYKANPLTVFDEIAEGLNNATSAEQRSELIEQIKEYSPFFNQAGASFKQMVATINKGDELGIYADKAADAIKETNIKLSEANKGTVDAVKNAFGANFANDIFARIKDGSLSTFDALAEMSTKLGEVDLNPKQYAELVANIGGGALEDAGRTFFEAFGSVNDATNANSEALTENQKRLQKQIEVEKQVSAAKIELTNEVRGLSNSYSVITQQIQVYLIQSLVTFLQILKSIPSFISENKEALILLATALVTFNAQSIAAAANTLRLSATQKLAVIQQKAMTIAQRGLNTAMRLNPIGAVVTVIALLAAGLVTLYKRSETVRNGINNLFAQFMQLYESNQLVRAALFMIVEPIKLIVKGFQDGQFAIDGFVAVAKAMVENVKTRFSILGSQAERLALQLQKAVTINGDKRAALAKQLRDVENEIEKSRSKITNLDDTYNKAVTAAREKEEAKRKAAEKKAAAESVAMSKSATAARIESDKVATKAITASTKKVAAEAKAAKGSIADLRKQISELETALTTEIDPNVDVEKAAAIVAEIDKLKAKLDEAEEAIARIRNPRNATALPSELATITASSIETLDTSDALDVMMQRSQDALDATPLQLQIEADAALQDAKDKVAEIADATEQVASLVFDAVNDMQQRTSERLQSNVDDSKSALDNMIANSEDFNAKQIELEKKRLAEAEAEAKRHTNKMKAVQAVQIALQIAIGIAKAFAQSGAASPAVLPIALAALSGAFAIGTTLVGDAFFDGTDFLNLPTGATKGRDTIQGLVGHKPIRLHEGEAIVQADKNAQRHDAVKAIRRDGPLGDLLQDIAASYPHGMQSILSNLAATHAPITVDSSRFNTQNGALLDTMTGLTKEIKRLPSRMPQSAIGLDDAVVTRRVTTRQQRNLRNRKRAK